MSDFNHRVDELAELMTEFNLAEAELKGEDWKVAFRKNRIQHATTVMTAEPMGFVESAGEDEFEPDTTPVMEAKPTGMPINSPMNGIFYTSPSPNAPAFVQEGDVVEVGQVVGLIEAMKVFNEITAPTAGRVSKVLVTSGHVVAPGETLMYIG